VTPAAVLRRHAAAAAIIGAATALSALADPYVSAADLVMIYLLAIMVTALLGRGPSILAASLSVAAYDFFFVEPRLTFTVSEAAHLLTFAVMFAVGLAISTLMARIRRQEAAAHETALKVERATIRSDLLSSVSHDLRTPLAAITGAASTLREGGMSSEQQQELADAICVEAERLERLVANLLDMTRLQSGALEIKREVMPLEEPIGGALTRVDRVLAGRPVTVDLPPSLPMVAADPVLLEQLFVNLLDNAIKHTPPGTAIEIRARNGVGQMVVVEVADRGPGLAPGDEQRVFDPFVRGSGARAPGSGLGLAICRAIAEVHGGRMIATSRPGAGACFRLWLKGAEA
jgi:two-component system sensor histidine kinase KdpD